MRVTKYMIAFLNSSQQYVFKQLNSYSHNTSLKINSFEDQ